VKKIWNYLTPQEILGFYEQIEDMCNEKGYDVDEGINRLYERNMEGLKNPADITRQWIKHVLPVDLEDLKREEIYVYP
jgi:hypothetical protein